MGRFRNRLLVLIIGLVIVTQTVTLAAVLISTRRMVEARAAEQLRSGATLADNLIGFRASQLASGVALLAADFGFREAVASAHAPTIRSAARNHAQRIGADMVLVLDTHGQVLASTATASDDAGSSLAGLLEDAARMREQPNFRVFGAHAYQFFLAPVRTPETIAWVAMGFVADEALAARRIERGQYETTVDVAGGEEFRSLAATFNAMQSNIAAREADITYHAYHDPLTALPNRAGAVRTLESLVRGVASEVGAARDAGAALLLIELRNLRDINASLGLQVGDDVLREAARRLQQNAATTDTVARLGETQFLVIAPGCSAERAPLYAGQLAAVIRGGFHLAGVSLDLRLACGVCLFPAHGARADELLQRAQVALEDAEETRTRVALYRPGQDQEHRRRLALVTDLRRAIDQDQLSLVYQPKVAMATRSVRSLEALVRWTHPELGAVSPAEFVPLAESTGGSRQLTNWVLGAAIRQMGEWRRQGLELDLAVNLSAPDILDPDLSDEILRLLRRHQVDSTSLVLEITESAVMRDPQLAVRNMQWLRVAGIRFAIDDFGTGHSSLSQLSVLPVDELKIDRSFMSPADSGAVTIVTSTIELGHSMGLKVVAEGVEDAAAWNLLRRLGCDFAQGYLISPPLAPTQVEGFVRQANQVLPDSDSTVRQIRALDQLAGRTER